MIAASDAAAPSYRLRPEPFLELVRHGIQPRLLLPIFLVKEHALDLPRVIQAADTHPDQPHRQVTGRKSMA